MKLSQEHFQLFRAECEKYLERFGLKSWKIYYQFKKLNNYFGNAEWNLEGRVATITLAIGFPKPFDNLEQQIKETALHECLEILLAPLTTLARDRGFCKQDFDQEVHSIIRTLEKVIN